MLGSVYLSASDPGCGLVFFAAGLLMPNVQCFYTKVAKHAKESLFAGSRLRGLGDLGVNAEA